MRSLQNSSLKKRRSLGQIGLTQPNTPRNNYKPRRSDLRISQPGFQLLVPNLGPATWAPRPKQRPGFGKSAQTTPRSARTDSQETKPLFERRRLTDWQRKELLDFPQVYYLDPAPAEEPRSPTGLHKHDAIACRYEVCHGLGQGTFATVYAALDHKHQRKVAVKVAREGAEFQKAALRETEFLNAMRRSYASANYCVELLHFFTFRGHRVLVLEFCALSLRQRLQAINRLSVPETLMLAKQLVHGVSQLHAKGIVHSDLKPENLMFETELCRKLRLIDLGAASPHKKPLYQQVQTLYYRAPEVTFGFAYNRAIDMWSVGCVAAEAVLGKPLFCGKDEWDQLWCAAEYIGPPPPGFLEKAPRKAEFLAYKSRRVAGSKSLADLIRHPKLLSFVEACLKWDPASRLTTAECLANRLFK